jgi:hypothetical protein
MIVAEMVGDRIVVQASKAEFGPSRAKAIPGRRFDWDTMTNTYPLTWATCVALRQELGVALRLGDQLTKWAWDQRRKQEELESYRSGANADLPRVKEQAPALWKALHNRPFQLAGTSFMVQCKAACLGDEPRLGKTYQALAAVIESGAETILIACPKTAVRSVWAAKIRELTGEEAYVAQEERAHREMWLDKFISRATGRKWLVINKEMIRVKRRFYCPNGTEWRIKPGRKNGCQTEHKHVTKHIPEFPQVHAVTYDAVLLDECHHVLATTKNTMSDGISQIRAGAMRLNTSDGGLRLALSGTPFRSDLLNSWGVLNWLAPKEYNSFWRYADEHWGVRQNGWGGARTINPKLKNPAAFDAQLRRRYLARTKAEVAPQLPPVDYVDVLLDMSPKQAKAYDEIVEDGLAKLDDANLLANGVLAELTRMRQFASAYGKLSGRDFIPSQPSNKLDWLLQFLEERKATGIKVVVATGFTKLAGMFANAIIDAGYQTVLLTGETTGRRRDQVQDQFQNGSAEVIIINMFAGGEAIDLSAADELVFLDEPWTDDTRQQAENRIVNLGKDHQLTVYRLRSEGTIEEDIADMDEEQRRQLMAAKPKVIEALKERASA